MTPNLALALEDFIPVFLTLFSLIWLTRMVFDMDPRSGYVSAAGALLVVSGGLLKAISKLLWATSGELIVWMENSLFILMAPGFALLAWAIWTGQNTLFRGKRNRYVFQIPVAFVLLLFGGVANLSSEDGSRTWFFILLTMVVLMSSVMLVLLSRHAWKFKRKDIAALFILYLVLTILLNGMARTPSPTIAVEWTKQMMTTLAASILAVASWKLWQATRNQEIISSL